MRDVKTIYFDVVNGTYLNADLDAVSTEKPVLYVRNAYVCKVTLAEIDVGTIDYSAMVSWQAGYGNLGTNDPIVTVEDADFNIDTGANPTYGVITFRIDLNDVAVATDIGVANMKTSYIEIRATDGDSVVHTIGVLPILVKNTLWTPELPS